MQPVKKDGDKAAPSANASKRLCTPAVRKQFGRDCSIQAGEQVEGGGIPYVVHVRKQGTGEADAIDVDALPSINQRERSPVYIDLTSDREGEGDVDTTSMDIDTPPSRATDLSSAKSTTIPRSSPSNGPQSAPRKPASSAPRSGRPVSRNATPGPSRIRGQPAGDQLSSRPPSYARISQLASATSPSSRTGSATPTTATHRSLSPTYISSDSDDDSDASSTSSYASPISTDGPGRQTRKRKIAYRSQGRRTFPVLAEPDHRPEVDLWPAASVPPAPHAAAHRILALPENEEYPIVTVSHRGDLQFFRPYEGDAFERMDRIRLTRLQSKSIPAEGANLVADACVTASGKVVLAYHNGPVQVAHMQFPTTPAGRPRLLPAPSRGPHTPVKRSDRPDKTLTCLARAVGSGQDGFFTGGCDKQIYSWTFGADADVSSDDEDDVPHPHRTRSPKLRRTKVLQLPCEPRALANAGSKLFVGYRKTLEEADLAHPTAKYVLAKLSNSVHQMHVNRKVDSLIMLETDHRDYQNQLFDTRKGGFAGLPVLQFGHRTTRPDRTYHKGDFWLSYFARGYPDHSLRVWDLRNVGKPVLTTAHTTSCKVTHTVFRGAGTVLAFGKFDVFCVDVKRNNT
ncbi:hypothetical protein HDZ31DRAFT_65140 [Schizophyllum fasciatum]